MSPRNFTPVAAQGAWPVRSRLRGGDFRAAIGSLRFTAEPLGRSGGCRDRPLARRPAAEESDLLPNPPRKQGSTPRLGRFGSLLTRRVGIGVAPGRCPGLT